MRKLIAILLMISLFICLFTACDNNGESGGEQNNENENGSNVTLPDYGKKVGDRCFPTSLSLISGDGGVNVSDYSDKIVVLNFWGTWCGPCVGELPHFDKLASEYSGEVVFIAVHSNSGVEKAPEFISTNYPSSKIIFAKDGANEKYYNLVAGSGYYPSTLILDKNNVISFSEYGVLSESELKAEIEKLR